MKEIISKGKFGKLIKISEYIQIPNLQYDRYNKLNNNPYILLSDIKDKYDLVRGTASEEDFWSDIINKLQQGKVNGYQFDRIYETDTNIAIVEVPKNESTHIFWIPTEGRLTYEELDWLYANTEEDTLCINGEHVTEIYTMSLKMLDSG